MAKQTTYVAWLRGINVGGNRLVPMAQLRTCFEDLGFESVSTYINSGNVIFKAPAGKSVALEPKIEKELTKRFKHEIAVVVRSLAEMEKVVAKIPKGWSVSKDVRCNVIFLKADIDNKKSLAELEAKPGIEELTVQPGVLFWSANASTLTKTNMLKLASNPLYKRMTIRNLNTTLKVADLMRKTDAG